MTARSFYQVGFVSIIAATSLLLEYESRRSRGRWAEKDRASGFFSAFLQGTMYGGSAVLQ